MNDSSVLPRSAGTLSDPFTREVIQDGLIAISDEMFFALKQTSMSPIIYEVLDFASGLTDRDGQLITQGNGVTCFLGTLTAGVQSVLEKFGQENLASRDVILTNDPYGGGGTHLSDITVVVPIFFCEALVGFAASKAHWTEVGGKDPGSATTDSQEVFAEGLQLPCIKVYEAGSPVQAVLDLISANVRLPAMTLGDLHAQVASVELGARRYQEMCAKYGLPAVMQAVTDLLDYGERLTLRELRRLPQGVYRARDVIDDDGLGNGPFPVQVEITITQNEFICDFTGSHPQVPGPVNTTMTGLISGARTMFKAITGPQVSANEGCFRPLRVICPEGTIFSARRPAPVAIYWEAINYATDLIWKALAEVIPERLPAGHFLSVCSSLFAGTHPVTGDLFVYPEPNVGGWGAASFKDGESAQFCVSDGETFTVPIEVAETRYGIRIERFELDPTDAGAGKFRGGLGTVREVRSLGDDLTFTAKFTRHRVPPWGAAGGEDGTCNRIEIVAEDGQVATYGIIVRHRLRKGDVVRLITGAGGGWGHPKDRAASAVLEDVRNGYITAEQAHARYGVEFAVSDLDGDSSGHPGASERRDGRFQ